MPIFVVTYAYPDRPAELDAVRPAHRAFLAELHAEGTLFASGPLPGDEIDPPGGLIILRADSVKDAERILDADPFAVAGLVATRRIRPWSPVIGDWADRV